VSGTRSGGISTAGFFSGPYTKVSAKGHQPEYEMFGGRDLPFHGDYLWIRVGGRESLRRLGEQPRRRAGTDIREQTQDGFDAGRLDPDEYHPVTQDECPNAGGPNQNIYGAALTL
jgi:hypothetical protein